MKLLKTLPLLTLVGLAFHSIYIVLTSEYIFDNKGYIGLGLLAICAVLNFIKKQLYEYTMLVTLLLGTFGLIAFTYHYTIIQIFIPIQPLVLLVLIFFLGINYGDFKKRYDDWMAKGTITPNSSKINSFKKRFEKLSDSEIELKLNENLVDEANEALLQIQKERNNQI